MSHQPIRAAGIAFIWKFIEMGGVKITYLVRLLVLAILLKPEDFGLVAIATTATGFLLNLTNLGLVPALVQVDTADEEKYDSVWIFEMTRAIIVAALTIILAPQIADIFAEPQAVPIIQALALRPLLESMVSIKVVALNRGLSFRPLAYLRIVEAIFSTILSIALAKTLGVWAMIIGVLGGTSAMVIASYFFVPHWPRPHFRWKHIQPLIGFGGWLLATSLIAMASNYGLRVLISRQLGAEGLGLYFLAMQLAFLPNEVVSEVVGAIAFPLFSRLQNEIAQATRVFRAMLSVLTAVLYPVCMLIVILAPAVVHDFLGPSWLGTEDVIRILSVVVIIGILGDIAVSVFKGFGQPYRITWLEVVQSATTLAFMGVLIRNFGLAGAAFAWVPAVLLSQIMSVIFLQNILEHPFRGMFCPIITVLSATALCTVTAWIARSVWPGIHGSIIATIAGLVMAAALILWIDRRHNIGFMSNLALLSPKLAQYLGFQPIEKRGSKLQPSD
jgi:O-antigen/teichoic acid export membrane protein